MGGSRFLGYMQILHHFIKQVQDRMNMLKVWSVIEGFSKKETF